MTEKQVLGIFKKTGALLEGHFLLSSGLHSANYLQCALLLADPKVAAALCKQLSVKLKTARPTVVVGPALGGVIVAYELARALGAKGLFTERVDGKMTLRRGFVLGRADRVVICEDVITTGKSTKEVIEVVRATGADIVGIGCIVDRSGQAADMGMPVKSLLAINIPAYEAPDCPLCKKGVACVKPGSRPGPVRSY